MSASEWARALDKVLPNAKTEYSISRNGTLGISKDWSQSPSPDIVWNAMDDFAKQHHMVKQCGNDAARYTVFGMLWGVFFGVVIALCARTGRSTQSAYGILAAIVIGALFGFMAGRTQKHCRYLPEKYS
jgi:hypothetical protein